MAPSQTPSRTPLCGKKFIVSIIIVATTIIFPILVENFYRHTNPESFMRPSNTLNSIAQCAEIWFEWIGFRVASFTDIYMFIKEYILEDARLIIEAMVALISSPFYAVKGWCTYYAGSLSPTEYGNVGIIIVIPILVGVFMCLFGPPGYPSNVGSEREEKE